jgi:hypothetical protein
MAAAVNPNGVASVSPGLRGTSYPGWAVGMLPNPQGLQPGVSFTRWVNSPSGAANPVTVPAALPTKLYRVNKP